MESNEQTELTRKMWTDSEMESKITASRDGLGGKGIEQKGKGLMDMDNSGVIAGGRGV